MANRLIVLAGPDEGRIFSLGAETLLLGRSRATETHLIDPHVSRVHCQVQMENGRHVLVDFDSAGGTFVNGKRVERHVLNHGDLIRIGGTRLQFESIAAESVPAESVPASAGAETTLERAFVTPTETEPSPPAKPAAANLPPGVLDKNWYRKLEGQDFGSYRIGSLLAKGRTSFLYHARDTRKNVPLVLKVLKPEYCDEEHEVRRFVDMMKRTMPLRHPNLLKIFGAGKTGPHLWIAEEYVPSESLAAIIARIEIAGMLDWRQVLRVGIYLARALDYAHQKEILHLAVTPQNVLMGAEPRFTKLTDLMLAAALQGDPTLPISAAGVPSEELSYMPPERTDGPAGKVDVRTDIYSLGATLYAMLAGHPPFKASTVEELVRMIRLQAPASLASLMLGTPAELEVISQRLLAKRPDDRYPTVKEVLADLTKIAKDYKVSV